MTSALSPTSAFTQLLREAIDTHRFEKLVLAKRRSVPPDGDRASAASAGDDRDLKRLSVRLIQLRGEAMLSLVLTHATKDITRNLLIADGIAHIERLLDATFSHAHLTTTGESIELRLSQKGRQTLRRTPASSSTKEPDPRRHSAPTFFAVAPGDGEVDAMSHDQPKRRYVDVCAPYLVALGVTDAQHRVVPAMARKWKQINKFVEIVDHALVTSGLASPAVSARGAETIRIADFGCGKGYLTFAVHEHVLRARDLAVRTTGVELRVDLVEAANRVAAAAQLEGLHFEAGDLRSHRPPALDVMVALHACDTATDHAIHLGLNAGARVIMCSPCCHRELRPQMARPAALDPMLRHGVHLGQQAEMVTDSLRALWLEAEGYDAQVFEFVALEHTSKNKMILAVKRADTESPKARALAMGAREEIARIKAFYAIDEQCLESLRRAHAKASGASETNALSGG